MKTTAFTLIESLVAVAILMLAVTGPLYASSRQLDAAALARNQLIASSLAQEAIEFVRSDRDNAFIFYGYTGADPNWWANDFIAASIGNDYRIGQCDNSITSSVKCTFDPTVSGSNPLVPCNGGVCAPLQLSSSPPFYKQSSGANTIFTRSVSFTDVGTPPTEVEELVTVDVSWYELGKTFHVILTDHLTPWQ